jgi:hypothetical protein
VSAPSLDPVRVPFSLFNGEIDGLGPVAAGGPGGDAMGSVASLLAGHVSLRLCSVDRIFLQGYVPQLMTEGQVVRFLLNRGAKIPSPAVLGRNHDRFVADIEAFAAAQGVEVVRFGKGEIKEHAARPYLAAAQTAGRDAVALIGVAQERVSGWRGWKDPNDPRGQPGHPHFCYRRQSLFVNHYYVYLWDRDFGPAFIKFCPYAPYPIWVWCNGHEWAKQQLRRAGIGFEALDNGFRSVADAPAAQRICDRLDARHIDAFVRRWLARLPSPFIETDQQIGLGYEFSVRQFEYSDTAVFDRPTNGRAWFEAAIRDHLDLGRPQRVSLVVNRRINRATKGRFATEVITKDVDPQIQVHYKASKVKAYFKEQRALRVETTINNPDDFGIRRRLNTDNWQQLRDTGRQVNTRFLAALGEDQPPPPDAATLTAVVLPSLSADGQPAPGLRFGDPRVMALLAAVAAFSHAIGGLTNHSLVALVQGLYQPGYHHRQATYDLRRLRRNGLITRQPGTHTYRITDHGRAIATLFTKLAARIVIPTLTDLEQPAQPPGPRPLTTAWRAYEHQLTTTLRAAGLTT